MKVRVLLFAALRERAGRNELELELPDDACVADALAAVEHLAPDMCLVLAVNREYATPDVRLSAGDELAVVPPVSGGEPVHAVVRDGPLSLDAVVKRVRDPRAGAVVTFSGVTREVAFLDYEAYVEMAEPRIAEIVAEAIARHGLCAAAAEHRHGRVALSEASVVVAASAPHRGEAFAGAREIIDRIKAEAPIWKREEGAWVAGTAPPTAGEQVIDVALDIRLEHGTEVWLTHGDRTLPARAGWLGGRFHQLRCAAQLTVARGDRLEVRADADGEVLGAAVVLDPHARRHGPSNDALVRLARLERGDDDGPPPLDADALALERRYQAAGVAPPRDAELTDDERAALFALREAGRVVRREPGVHVHVDVHTA